MDRDFRRPKNFASFLYVGQVLQATVIKFARPEAHRRAMGRNWGSLYWQLDGPAGRSRPGRASTTTYGRWKALHILLRASFLRAGAGEPRRGQGGRQRVWAISDRRTDTPARLTLRLNRLSAGASSGAKSRTSS